MACVRLIKTEGWEGGVTFLAILHVLIRNEVRTELQLPRT